MAERIGDLSEASFPCTTFVWLFPFPSSLTMLWWRPVLSELGLRKTRAKKTAVILVQRGLGCQIQLGPNRKDAGPHKSFDVQPPATLKISGRLEGQWAGTKVTGTLDMVGERHQRRMED